MAYTIIPRHGTAAEYAAVGNRIYIKGEMLLEEQLDGTYKLKIGDGINLYNNLPYLGTSGGTGSNAFGVIAVSGQSSVAADAAPDILTLESGSGISLTTNSATDTVQINPVYGTTSGTICQGNDSRFSTNPQPGAHATTHYANGSDPVKLDSLAPPDDVTTLNATTSAHGLLRKLNNSSTQFLNGAGNWATPATTSALPYINVKDYGAVADNSTLNDSAFAAAIAASSGRVYFPAGTYRVSSVTNINKSGIYYGDGPGTYIRTTSATADVLNVTAPGVVIRDLTFDSSATRTAGKYVILGAVEGRIQDFKMTGAFIGVHVPDVANIAVITIQGGHIRSTVPTGTCILIDGGFDVSIRDVISDSVPVSAIGISVTQVGDLTIEDCNIIRSNIALNIWPAPGKFCASIQANNTFFDTAGTHGMMMVGQSGGLIVRCMFDECWFSSAGTSGVTMLATDGTIDGIDFTGCQFMLNGTNGMHIIGPVKDIGIIGGGFGQNGDSGISIESGASDIMINGVRSGNTHGLSPNNYGIYVSAGVSRYVIANNNLLGNNVAGLVDSGSAPKFVSGNLV